ncbi:MAG: hypothetical protein GX951_00375 [Mollicutes bacterium]|nr:hypothetical protein [Mollicutes bacterium]
MITKEQIIKLADDLLIALNKEEITDLLNDFKALKERMKLINNVKGLKKTDILSFPQDIKTTVLRDDKDVANISTTDALKNSSNAYEDIIEVPKVVG